MLLFMKLKFFELFEISYLAITYRKQISFILRIAYYEDILRLYCYGLCRGITFSLHQM